MSSSTASEQQRWVRTLALPFFGPCAAVAASLATGQPWLMAPAIVLGPGLGIIALTYLALTSDVTGNAGELVVLGREDESLRRAA